MAAFFINKRSLPVLFFFSLLYSSPEAKSHAELKFKFHREAKPLSPQAVTSDWPRFNGPNDDAICRESLIELGWANGSPSLLWEAEKGDGYASPAIAEGKLVMFHRFRGDEVIEARDAGNGSLLWRHSYPVVYEDRYGYLNGPRASPVIAFGHVYLLGVTACLTCLDLTTGEVCWKRNLGEEFDIPQNFFGKGSNPLIVEKTLIINVGGSQKRSVIGLDLKTGQTKWVTKDEWGASYSSPRKTVIHRREVCLVFAGGESRPSTGGLLVIDPQDGTKLSRFPWRSKSYESVNAVPPIPLGKNRVYLSECYEKGSVILQFDDQFNAHEIWQDSSLNIHWMTPVVSGSFLYGVSGRHQRGAQVYCLDFNEGVLKWHQPISWSQVVNERDLDLQLFRGSLLKIGVESNHFIGLSEFGSLVSLKLSPLGWELISKAQLFFAPGTWTLPAVSQGLLYVMQNEKDRMTGEGARLLCYDLRGK